MLRYMADCDYRMIGELRSQALVVEGTLAEAEHELGCADTLGLRSNSKSSM
jgi:hypothetical protein